MTVLERRLQILSEEEIQQYLPGILVAELFYSEINLAEIPHEDSRELRDYIDEVYLLGKKHQLNTFKIQRVVESFIESIKEESLSINTDEFLSDFDL